MEGFSNDQLFTKGVYKFRTGGTKSETITVSATSVTMIELKNSKLIRKIVRIERVYEGWKIFF